MPPERRSEIKKILEESVQAFHSVAVGVPDEKARLHPSPGQWSVYEIVEHVALAEHGMFRILKAATPIEESLENSAREAELVGKTKSRTVRAQAPDRVIPTGRFATLPEALSQVAAAREQTIRFVRETELDLFRVSAAHPLLGPVSGYELLLIMAGHFHRHAEQIAETKSSLG